MNIPLYNNTRKQYINFYNESSNNLSNNFPISYFYNEYFSFLNNENDNEIIKSILKGPSFERKNEFLLLRRIDYKVFDYLNENYEGIREVHLVNYIQQWFVCKLKGFLDNLKKAGKTIRITTGEWNFKKYKKLGFVILRHFRKNLRKEIEDIYNWYIQGIPAQDILRMVKAKWDIKKMSLILLNRIIHKLKTEGKEKGKEEAYNMVRKFFTWQLKEEVKRICIWHGINPPKSIFQLLKIRNSLRFSKNLGKPPPLSSLILR